MASLHVTLPSIAHDPGYASVRRGLRAALVVPLLLGSAMLLSAGQAVATFLLFGVMALLVFAYFGGTSRSRVIAYLAVAASALVGFVLSGLGILDGYFLNARTALMLAFILAVTNVASPLRGIADDVIRAVGATRPGIKVRVTSRKLWAAFA